MSIEYVLKSKGCVRKQYEGRNHDSALAEERGGVLVMAVADGVGPIWQAEYAARAVIGALEDADPWNNGILEAAKQASQAITDSDEGFASTLTALRIQDHTLTVAQCGDSAAYLLRQGIPPVQLTEEHTFYADNRNVLDRAIDFYAGPEVIDTFRTPSPIPLESKGSDRYLLLQESDLIIICTDGAIQPLIANIDCLQQNPNGADLSTFIDRIITGGIQRDDTSIGIARLKPAQ